MTMEDHGSRYLCIHKTYFDPSTTPGLQAVHLSNGQGMGFHQDTPWEEILKGQGLCERPLGATGDNIGLLYEKKSI